MSFTIASRVESGFPPGAQDPVPFEISTSPGQDAAEPEGSEEEAPGRLFAVHGEDVFLYPISDDLVWITRELRTIQERLQQFRKICTDSDDGDCCPSQAQVELSLQGLLSSLEPLLQRYPAVHSQSVRRAIAAVRDSANELNCEARGKEKCKRYSEIFRDFDALEISIGNSVVDTLLGDADTQSISTTASLETQDTDELPSDEGFCVEYRRDSEDKELSIITAQNADAALLRSEGGVETALLYAKLWCKYAKELLAWMERRLSLELDFAKNIIRTAEAAKSSVASQVTERPHRLQQPSTLSHCTSRETILTLNTTQTPTALHTVTVTLYQQRPSSP
ncbi:rho GTPase-activating protein 29-like [Polyodon spathula]|uniref:rho GTPase-activating protein 29-like n=1 Tax=Polyodon spathula TaxID=7913 RepID=UPI001B7DCF1B|nr:rho GTPase-activating protein 29-like [Polyodon spathula]